MVMAAILNAGFLYICKVQITCPKNVTFAVSALLLKKAFQDLTIYVVFINIIGCAHRVHIHYKTVFNIL